MSHATPAAATSDAHAADPHAHAEHGGGHGGSDYHTHVVSPAILLGTFAVLLVLTVLTVAVTYVDLGAWNKAVALAVAVAKASVVALYFMHLRWDSMLNAIVLIGAMLFLALFIAIAMIDSVEYQQYIDGPPAFQHQVEEASGSR